MQCLALANHIQDSRVFRTGVGKVHTETNIKSRNYGPFCLPDTNGKRLSAHSDINASLAFRIFRVYRVPQEKNFSLSYFVFKITVANHLARSLNHFRETDRSSTRCCRVNRRIEEMDNQLTLIIVVAMLVIIFAQVGAWVYTRSSRSRRLKAKFGPEYDQTVERLHN